MLCELLADGDSGGGSVAVHIIMLLVMLLVSTIIYFIPTIVAGSRNVQNTGSVFVINLFLGWTLVGWVVALAMAVRTVEQDRLPPSGSRVAICPRCNAQQNVRVGAETFKCWQCKAVVHRPGTKRRELSPNLKGPAQRRRQPGLEQSRWWQWRWWRDE